MLLTVVESSNSQSGGIDTGDSRVQRGKVGIRPQAAQTKGNRLTLKPEKKRRIICSE